MDEGASSSNWLDRGCVQMKDQDDGSKVLKAVLIGDGSVGKTSIRRNRYKLSKISISQKA